MSSRVQSIFDTGPGRVMTHVLSSIMLVGALRLAEVAGAAYLPVVGPSPIRIQSRPKPAKLPLPPLPAVPQAQVAAPTNDLAPSWISNLVANASTPLTWTARPSQPQVSNPAEPELPFAPGMESEPESRLPVLTPQMLVPFFEHRTFRPEGKETGVVAPLPFVPPRSSPGATSRAVLRND